MTFSIVTCDAIDPLVPTLRRSVETNLIPDPPEIIAVVGASSIARAYNEGARRATGDCLLFTHSDVEILSQREVLDQVAASLEEPHSGVVGIAGTRLLQGDATWWQADGHLSGECRHRDTTTVVSTRFGGFGRVVVLDGVLLLVSRRVFSEIGGFDERFPGWDFYDLDFTLRAHLAGFSNSTVPLDVLHHSPGDVSNKPGWWENRSRFLAKWGALLPVSLS